MHKYLQLHESSTVCMYVRGAGSHIACCENKTTIVTISCPQQVTVIHINYY